MNTATIGKELFGTTPEGQEIFVYTLTNGTGSKARILNFGGIVQSLEVPDRHGKAGDVVLGYDTLEGYLTNPAYLGAIIGRVGNRIGGASFSLDGKTYELAANAGSDHLHGGKKGFEKAVQTSFTSMTPEGPSIMLTFVSPDGEEGYPGNLSVTLIYTLSTDHSLRMEIVATSDQRTVCNMTHHSYFNFKGTGDILDHSVQIFANHITEVTPGSIPTGNLYPVEGTPFDFRCETPIGLRIEDSNTLLKYGRGYDHNYVINKPLGEMGLMAKVGEPSTGRVMEVWSNAPGVQFYVGNYLDGSIIGKGEQPYQKRGGFCFEPQYFPDSPNHLNFPSIILEAGAVYRHSMIFKFAIR